jgi:transposase
MMSTTAQQPATTPIPVQLSETEFTAFILPHLSMPKRGRKRLFNAALHALRMRVERTFAWEDKFKRLLLRFERIQHRHYGMKLLGYTMINLRAFCRA